MVPFYSSRVPNPRSCTNPGDEGFAFVHFTSISSNLCPAYKTLPEELPGLSNWPTQKVRQFSAVWKCYIYWIRFFKSHFLSWKGHPSNYSPSCDWNKGDIFSRKRAIIFSCWFLHSHPSLYLSLRRGISIGSIFIWYVFSFFFFNFPIYTCQSHPSFVFVCAEKDWLLVAAGRSCCDLAPPISYILILYYML